MFAGVGLAVAVALVGIGFTTALAAKTLLLPVQAIEDSRYFSAAEFRQMYPGINLGSRLPASAGWYVRYNHEKLTYFYGPVETREVAEAHRQNLADIVGEAAAERDSLNSATITLFQFDPAQARAIIAENRAASERSAAEAAAGGSGEPGSSQPAGQGASTPAPAGGNAGGESPGASDGTPENITSNPTQDNNNDDADESDQNSSNSGNGNNSNSGKHSNSGGFFGFLRKLFGF